MSIVAACNVVQLIDRECESVLIIDCRSFLTYNKGHIKNAVNVMRSNSIMKRRSRGVFSLESTIINSETREKFLNGKISDVLVYDEQGDLTSEDIESAAQKRTAISAIKALQANAPLDTVNILYLEGE